MNEHHHPGRRRLLIGAAALALAVPLGACGLVTDKIDEAKQAAKDAIPSTAGRARLAEHPLSKDMEALRTAVGAEDLRVFDLTITESTIVASVQDPKKPENVDAYALDGDGTWGAARPVELIGSGELEANLFSSKDVAWDKIDGLADQALEKLPMEGAELGAILVQMGFDGSVQITVSVDGLRSSGSLRAKADGTVIEATET